MKSSIRWRGDHFGQHCSIMILASLVFFGCEKTEDELSGCAELGLELCTRIDEVRCNSEAEVAEECQQSDEIEGCLLWMTVEICGDNQVCQLSGSTSQCICYDECDVVDQSFCDEAMIRRCWQDDQGCLFLEDDVDCAAEGALCDDSGDEAICVSNCDQCEPDGTTRCQGNLIQICAPREDGCLDWADSHDCTIDGQICDESTGEGHCGCDNTCLFNELRCSDDLSVVEVCGERGDGCLDWITFTDCTLEDLLCDETGVGPHCACATTCSDGARRCEAEVVQECDALMTGCGDWIDIADCAASGLSCFEEDLSAICETASGDSCAETQVLWFCPIEISGENFSADYRDTLWLTGEGCDCEEGQPEAVLAIDVEAGEELEIAQTQPWPVSISVVTSCDGAAACEASEVLVGDEAPLRFVATEAGRLYLVVEARSEEPSTEPYTIFINRSVP